MFHERIKKNALHKTSLSGVLKSKQKCVPNFQFQGNAFHCSTSWNDGSLRKSIQNVINNARIYKWKNIESVQIKGNSLTNEIMLDLESLFKNHILEIKTVILKFAKTRLVLQQGLRALAYGMGRHLKDLKKLMISFPISFVHNSQELSELVKQIGLYCNRLKEFSFDLGLIRSMRLKAPKTFALFRSRIARYFSRIEKLSVDSKDLEFGSLDNVIDFIIMERIGQGRMTNLKKLSINLEDNMSLRYQAFERLFSYLCESTGNLQDLSLNLSSCSVSARNIKDSILGIENVAESNGAKQKKRKKNIKRLTLLFNFNAHFGDQGMKDLVSDITKRNLDESLENLKLGFVDCKEITIDGFEILCFNLSEYFLHLKSLDLNLHGCKISNAGLKAGMGALKKCIQRIEKLTLNFFGCKNISDEGLEAFTDVLIGNGLNLKEISLTFDLEFIIDKGIIEDFGQRIGQAFTNGMRYLWLRLLNCREEVVNDEVKENFWKNFDKIQKLVIKWE